MSNVYQLPESMERQWRVFAEKLRQAILSGGCTAHEADTALAGVKPLYLKAAAPKTFSGTGVQIVEALNEWVHGTTFALLMALVVREIELQRAGAR